jgi:hypothetical protein
MPLIHLKFKACLSAGEPGPKAAHIGSFGARQLPFIERRADERLVRPSAAAQLTH